MSVGAVNKSTGERIPAAGMPVIDVALSGSSTNPVQNRVVKAALDEKADTDIVASDFDATASYTAGNYCIYEGKFYRFKTTHSGAWVAADVDEIKIAGELSALKSGLTNLLKRGYFNIACQQGENVFNTTTAQLVSGSFPDIASDCIYQIVNHGTSYSPPNVIEVDGSETIIITATVAQNIQVMWIQFSNIPLVN